MHSTVPLIIVLVLAAASIAVVSTLALRDKFSNDDSPAWSRGYVTVPVFEGYISKALPINRKKCMN